MMGLVGRANHPLWGQEKAKQQSVSVVPGSNQGKTAVSECGAGVSKEKQQPVSAVPGPARQVGSR